MALKVIKQMVHKDTFSLILRDCNIQIPSLNIYNIAIGIKEEVVEEEEATWYSPDLH